MSQATLFFMMKGKGFARAFVCMAMIIFIVAAAPGKVWASFSVGALRGSEKFDETLRSDSPWFFEHGEFSMQGINQYGYTGTCGEAALANAMNHIFSTSYYTENMLVKMAVDRNLCTTQSEIKENLGGMSPEQMMYLITFLNNVAGTDILEYSISMDHIAKNVFKQPEYSMGGVYVCDNSIELKEDDVAGVDAVMMVTKGVPDVEAMAEDIDNGCVYVECVDSNILWDFDRAIVESVGMKYIASNHWIAVTNTIRDKTGKLLGFYVVDSGTGTKTVLKDKMHTMIFGLPNEPITDAACIRINPLESGKAGR